MSDAGSKEVKAVPPMGELLETLKKLRLLSEDDCTVLDAMSIDSSEIAKETPEITKEESEAEETVENEEVKMSQDAKSFALTLYYYSPEAYNYVYTNYETLLPSVALLKTLYKHKGGVPGFTEESLEFIEEMAAKSDKKVFCSLTLKELDDYHSVLQYVNGVGYGYEDIGSEIDTDCQNCASTCIMFSVAAVNDTWNVPVGYFLLYFTTSERIARLVNIGVYLLEKCNVNVVGVSFPANSKYLAAAQDLGCDITGDMKNLKTTFESESNRKICVFPDCKKHAAEEICMVWREAGQTFKDGEGNSIVYTYIAQLKEGSRTVKKRIFPFSKDVSVKLVHNKDTLQSPSFANAHGTIKFINYVIEALDTLSSKEDGGGLNRAVNEISKGQVIEKLDDIIKYFSSLEKVQHVHFSAFCIAAESVKVMIKNYLGEDGLDCIPFYKITSQPAEEITIKLKRRAGPNYNAITACSLKKAYNALLRELKIVGYK